MADLIDSAEAVEWFMPYLHEGLNIDPYTVIGDIKAFRAVDAVEVGNCKGCTWSYRKRPQKCSCCRRNPDMKDCYEVDV